MSKLEIEYLKHILDEINYLLETSKDMAEGDFARSLTFQKAFTRSLEVIGEASKNLSSSFKNENKNIDWKSMSGMRDRLIHHYFGVDFEIVWDVVKNEIPNLRLKIIKLVESKSKIGS